MICFKGFLKTTEDSLPISQDARFEEKITFDDLQSANALFGIHGGNLRRIGKATGVKIHAKAMISSSRATIST